MIETFTLDNGLRVVTDTSPTDVVYCGLAVDAGTRDEREGEEGIAHFTEHLTFKGTQRRRSWHVLNRMEVVGGDLNAYTGKEETVYYCTFLKPHLARAIDLLVDIVFNSTYPQGEMDKEVEVVIDEIESYKDSPAELIFDDFENLIFQGHALGHNILGESDGLRRMKHDDIRCFTQRLYVPSRMVFFVKGNVSPQTVLKELQRAFKHTALNTLPSSAGTTTPNRTPPPPYQAQEVVIQKDTHQAHVMMGTRSFAADDKRHLALYLLNNILGGPGMNSRLNLALRERNGLVYSVESSAIAYTDTGVWSIYFGCDPEDVTRCKRLVLKELKRLTDAPLSTAALAAAKQQLIGQMGVSYDSFENVAIGMGKRYLHYGTTQTYASMCQRIEALTSEELYATACELFRPEHLTTLVYL